MGSGLGPKNFPWPSTIGSSPAAAPLTQSMAPGMVGATSSLRAIAVADVPILNQNTSAKQSTGWRSSSSCLGTLREISHSGYVARVSVSSLRASITSSTGTQSLARRHPYGFPYGPVSNDHISTVATQPNQRSGFNIEIE
jgi:hypothetical protein